MLNILLRGSPFPGIVSSFLNSISFEPISALKYDGLTRSRTGDPERTRWHIILRMWLSPKF